MYERHLIINYSSDQLKINYVGHAWVMFSRQTVTSLCLVFVKMKDDRDVLKILKTPFCKLILVHRPPWVFVASTRLFVRHFDDFLTLYSSLIFWIAH